MAPIDFYYMPQSPPCRAVEMVAEMVGVKVNKHYVNLFTKEHLKDEFLKVNPLHKVPFIVDGELKLGESRAIMMYLVNKYKPENEHLYPRDPSKRALIDELMFYDIGTYYQASSKLFFPLIFGKKSDPNDEKAHKDSLEYLDKKLSEGRSTGFMLGDNVTIADISLVASFSLAYACSCDFSEHKHLIAYIERLKSAIPNYSAINDEATESMKKFIDSKRDQ